MPVPVLLLVLAPKLQPMQVLVSTSVSLSTPLVQPSGSRKKGAQWRDVRSRARQAFLFNMIP